MNLLLKGTRFYDCLIALVGQQVIVLTENRNSDESQKILEGWVNRNIKMIFVKKIAILLKFFLSGKSQY